MSSTGMGWPNGGERPTVGFIGLGRMGAAMAANLLRSGFDLVVHDVRPEAAESLVATAASAASPRAVAVDSPRAVGAASDVLVTMLPGPPQVEAALFGPDGAFEALRPRSVWIDMSTSTPPVGQRAAELGAQRSVGTLDAPVSGMVKGAAAGTLQIFVGGERETFERCLAVLEAMGDRERIFLAGGKGAGYAVKLCLNLLWFDHVAATAEVLMLGVRAGVDLEVLQRSLAASPAASAVVERDILPVFEGDYDESFTLDLVTKDLALAVDLGRQVGVPMEVSALVEQLHRRARLLYGDRAGELSAVRLVEDATKTYLRPRRPAVEA